jgi:aspartyl-tRNA(Asn)/glutamyl-tRNA(Gln) amidotransferase subunit B
MEEGSLRCDANVSIRPMGETKLGTRSELKNMNSFRFLTRAIEYEVERQKEILESGGKVIQETRLYDPDRNVTQSMRSKEEAHDYRYFPEPDLTPIEPSEAMIGEIRAGLPELPDARKNRFVTQYALPLYDAEVLTASRGVADYFESAAKDVKTPKLISNWVMGDILRVLNENALTAADCPVKPDSLAEMVQLIEDNVISGKIAKTVFEEMMTSGKRPKAIVAEKGLVQIADTGAIEAEVDKVIAANPSQLAEYKAGKIQLAAFFVGQVMRATKGKANPAMVNKILEERLGKA